TFTRLGQIPFSCRHTWLHRVRIDSPALGEARPIPPRNDLKTAVRSEGASRLPYFAADDEILARRRNVEFQASSATTRAAWRYWHGSRRRGRFAQRTRPEW